MATRRVSTKPTKLKSGEIIARALTEADAKQFVSSPRNRKLIGEMVIEKTRPPAGAPPSIKAVWVIKVK